MQYQNPPDPNNLNNPSRPAGPVNPELDALLTPPKNKSLLIISLVAAAFLVLGSVATGVLVYFISSSATDWANLDDRYSDNGDHDYHPSLLEITPEQAGSWLNENYSNMDNLTKAVMQFPAMHSLWLGFSSDMEHYNVYVWINDIPCTADPGQVRTDPNEELALFSDELKKISVPVVDFYAVANMLKEYGIEGYELYADSSGSLTGVELYHAGYAGVFYYAVDGKKPDGYTHNLQGDWWFIEP